MSVDIGQAVEEGAKRTVARNGLILVAVAWVLGVLNTLFGNTITRGMMEQIPTGPGAGPGAGPFGQPTVGPGLGLSPGVAGLLSLVVALLLVVLTAGAVRTFVTEDTETLPGERFTHNLGWMLLNLVVGGIVFGIVVGIGFVLLIIPGLFLLVSLFFWNVFVIVEDENFVEGFSNSWALTKGNRIMLFVLGVVVVIVSAIVGVVFGIPGAFLPGIVSVAVSQIGSAFTTVFGTATLARTYVQLTSEGPIAASE